MVWGKGDKKIQLAKKEMTSIKERLNHTAFIIAEHSTSSQKI